MTEESARTRPNSVREQKELPYGPKQPITPPLTPFSASEHEFTPLEELLTSPLLRTPSNNIVTSKSRAEDAGTVEARTSCSTGVVSLLPISEAGIGGGRHESQSHERASEMHQGRLGFPRNQTCVDAVSNSNTKPIRDRQSVKTATVLPGTEAPHHTVGLDVTSPFLDCWDKTFLFRRTKKKLFVGRPRVLPCPMDLVAQWEEEIKPRLMNDLVSVSSWSTPDEVFEAELRMAGLVRKEKTVQLHPTVCIRCTTKECQKEFEKATKDLDYLASFCFGRIEVRLGAPKLAATDPQSPRTSSPSCSEDSSISDEEDARLREAEMESLYLVRLALRKEARERERQTARQVGKETSILQDWWIQESFNGHSACGMKLQIVTSTCGMRVETISTIGGLIKIDERIYGLTTGHGIVAPPEPTRDVSVMSLDSSSSSESATSASDSDCSDCSDASAAHANPGSDHYGKITQQIKWKRTPASGPVSFCGRTKITHRGDVNHIPWNNSDFALVDMQLSPNFQLNNSYKDAVGSKTFCVNGTKHDVDLEDGEVLIVTETCQTISGYLLRGATSFRIKDALFQTRKIELNAPLPKGVSGSWVVQENRLCGIVVAVYDTEPYAHMITVDKVFQDIRNALQCSSIGVATKDDVAKATKKFGPFSSTSSNMEEPSAGFERTPSVSSDDSSDSLYPSIIGAGEDDPLDPTADSSLFLRRTNVRASQIRTPVPKTEVGKRPWMSVGCPRGGGRNHAIQEGTDLFQYANNIDTSNMSTRIITANEEYYGSSMHRSSVNRSCRSVVPNWGSLFPRAIPNWRSLAAVLASICSTLLSFTILLLARKRLHGESQETVDTFIWENPILFNSILVKIAELAFTASCTAFLGQLISARAWSNTGISLSELELLRITLQPNLLFSRRWVIELFKKGGIIPYVGLFTAVLAILFGPAGLNLLQPNPPMVYWASKSLTMAIQTDFANLRYITDHCDTDSRSSGNDTCPGEQALFDADRYLLLTTLRIHGMMGKTSHTFEEYLPDLVVNQNTTITGQWVDDLDKAVVSKAHHRKVNNVSLAMPHPGVVATVDTQPRIGPTGLLDHFSLHASVPSLVTNVLCVNLDASELIPLTTYDKSKNEVEQFVPTNKTDLNDIFGWDANLGSNHENFPKFTQLPGTHEMVTDDIAGFDRKSSIFVLGHVSASDEEIIHQPFVLCRMSAYASPFCSSRYNISGSTGSLEALCEDPNDEMEYIKTDRDAKELGIASWGDVARRWARALSSDKDNVESTTYNITSSIARTLLDVQETAITLGLKNKRLNIARALAGMSAWTLVKSMEDAPFDIHASDSDHSDSKELGSQRFKASLQTVQYTSYDSTNIHVGWLLVVYAVFTLSLVMTLFLLRRLYLGMLVDVTEPSNLFALAMNSLPQGILPASGEITLKKRVYSEKWTTGSMNGHYCWDPVVEPKKCEDVVEADWYTTTTHGLPVTSTSRRKRSWWP